MNEWMNEWRKEERKKPSVRKSYLLLISTIPEICPSQCPSIFSLWDQPIISNFQGQPTPIYTLLYVRYTTLPWTHCQVALHRAKSLGFLPIGEDFSLRPVFVTAAALGVTTPLLHWPPSELIPYRWGLGFQTCSARWKATTGAPFFHIASFLLPAC
jgi:hypothetical protein